MKQAWLAELYRQWKDARGVQITPRQRGFRRKWGALLEAAGLHSAEEQGAALRGAELMEKKGHIQLHRVPSRPYLVEKIELPLASESWLRKLFNQREPTEALQESLAEIAAARALNHERFPKLWKEWCETLETAFRSGRNARPLYWRAPENVKSMLTLIHRLTSMEWRKGALVREVSVDLGLESKDLEKQRRGVEACLGQMFGRPMPLPSLGIVLTDSRSDLAGILTLHFPTGEAQVFDKLKAVFGLSLSDLERAEYATTPAQRLLTVENSKTTLRRLASVNADGSTLLAACSFPTKALLRLLQLLPSDLRVFHFGDTDPAGYHILSKLREESGRTVVPFLMSKRPAKKKCPLGEYDEALLPGLIRNPLLQDVVSHLEEMKRSGCKGDFEQETIGLPDLGTWPFFSASRCEVT
jgi:hypothetical protein